SGPGVERGKAPGYSWRLTLDTPASSSRRAELALLSAFLLVSVVFSGVYPPSGAPHELSRVAAVYPAARTRRFAIHECTSRFSDDEDKSIANGHFYSNKAPGLTFAAIPVYRALRTVLPRPEVPWDPVFVLTRIATVTLAAVVAAAVFLRRARPLPEAPLIGA